jgi:hypothetical protein
VIDQPIYEGQPGCALAKVEKHTSGILECSYGGGNSSKKYMYYYNKNSNFHSMSAIIKSFKIIGSLTGSQLKLFLSFNRFHFNGLQEEESSCADYSSCEAEAIRVQTRCT